MKDSFYEIQAENATVSKVTVRLILGRKILNVILLNYLPTTLIVAIVFVSAFFKSFFFEAILTVNLTGKLLKRKEEVQSFSGFLDFIWEGTMS